MLKSRRLGNHHEIVKSDRKELKTKKRMVWEETRKLGSCLSLLRGGHWTAILSEKKINFFM